MPHVPEPFGHGKNHPLSHAIDSIEKKVEAYNAERGQLVTELENVIGRAQQLLSALGAGAAVRRRRRTAGNRGRRAAGGRPRRRMSAAARARISAAQKARWAKQKREQK